MSLKRMLRPTNRRVRLLVGLLLAALFCIQCSRSDAFRTSSTLVVPIAGRPVGQNSADIMSKVETLARTDHVALLQYCQANYKGRFLDYTCTVTKQERIDNVLGAEQQVEVKFMDSPFSVAMKWTKNPPPGEQALYVEGKYNGNMLVKPRGLLAVLGTQMRKPDCAEAKANSLRTINEFGFYRSLQSLIDVYRAAKARGDLKEEFGGYAEVAGRKAIALVRYLPARHDYPAKKTIICIDLEYLLPFCVEGYNWDDQLVCLYLYRDVKFNVGLKAEDFTPESNGIKPPK